MILALLLAAAPHVTWHGGKVLPAPKFYNLYWGSYWSSHPDEVAWFDGYTRTVAASKELASQVTEYSVNGQMLGAGSLGGSAVIPQDSAPTIADNDLDDFIWHQIQSGAVPQYDDHNVYAVFLAPGVKIQNEDHAAGYHGPSYWGFLKIMVHFDNYVLDVVSRETGAVIYSHEMAETITDPYLDGWYDDARGVQGEIGDLCGGHLSLVGEYTIQQEWSEVDHQCMASRDVPLPPNGGVCPDGTHLDGPDCYGNLISWGCGSAGAGWPSAAALGLLLLQRRRRRA